MSIDLKKIDHVGIAVKSIKESLKFYEGVLGLKCTGTEEVKSQKVITAFVPIGESEFELLEPTSDDSPIAKFIAKKREGIQHIAVRVDDVAAALEELKKQGMRLIDEKPRPGAGGAQIAFVHPKTTHGVLLELCQK
ncbi:MULTISPECIES: methylmalonyl-CoA epimerase [Clostridium]|uniref:Methylmalonyl-CoA epimerase n=1 Tax=Clostridium lapidicellarium TaxID=3240931 RepID=A0ABV4DZV7_9CLOT|nr:methylmalonyl-CoA epimerase [uncultured Clostridium sp.]NLU08428.1 methylmalonyl-CoA epimerase [Clostridiales bacterium]